MTTTPTTQPDDTPPTRTEGVLIELDGRRRASLGKLGRHTLYLASEREDGTIVLEPAVVMSEMEARLHRDHPELVQSIRDAMDHPERRVTRPRRTPRREAATG